MLRGARCAPQQWQEVYVLRVNACSQAQRLLARVMRRRAVRPRLGSGVSSRAGVISSSSPQQPSIIVAAVVPIIIALIIAVIAIILVAIVFVMLSLITACVLLMAVLIVGVGGWKGGDRR